MLGPKAARFGDVIFEALEQDDWTAFLADIKAIDSERVSEMETINLSHFLLPPIFASNIAQTINNGTDNQENRCDLAREPSLSAISPS